MTLVPAASVLIPLALAVLAGCASGRKEPDPSGVPPAQNRNPTAPVTAPPGATGLTGDGTSPLEGLLLPRNSGIAHYSSHHPRQKNDDFRRLEPGDTLTLFDHQGAGIVRRWWLTIAPRNHTAILRFPCECPPQAPTKW